MPKALILLFLFCSSAVSVSVARADDFALPVNPVVIGGQASVQTTGPGRMNVNQASQRAVINWDTFDIGEQARVTFVQPNTNAIAVNRVSGTNAQPTKILGSLQGNGRIVVLDANGVIFGPNSRVDAASMVASTGDINAPAFMAATTDRIILTTSGDARARVENQGRITVAESGLAALVAPHAANSGTINARAGKVVIAGTETATLDLYGDGLFTILAPAATHAVSATHSGTINAMDGVVELTTQDVQSSLDNVINMGGITNARSASRNSGVISLRTGQNGRIKIDGNAVAGRAVTVHADKDITLATSAAGAHPNIVLLGHDGTARDMTVTSKTGALVTNGLLSVFQNNSGGDLTVTQGGSGDLIAALDAVYNNDGHTTFVLGAAHYTGGGIITMNNLTIRAADAVAPALIAGHNYALWVKGDNVTLSNLQLEGTIDGLLVGDAAQTSTKLALDNVQIAGNRVGLFVQGSEIAGLGTTIITGGAYGLILDGTGATIANNTLGGLTLRGQSEQYIQLQNGAMAGQVLDANEVLFQASDEAADKASTGAAPPMSDNAYRALAQKIYDWYDLADLGRVFLGREAPVAAPPPRMTTDIRHYIGGGSLAGPVFPSLYAEGQVEKDAMTYGSLPLGLLLGKFYADDMILDPWDQEDEKDEIAASQTPMLTSLLSSF
ncbi:MAG: filamentous hemagglutinin N-terminal domain-containing protein [Pseudomonadota bacterium]